MSSRMLGRKYKRMTVKQQGTGRLSTKYVYIVKQVTNSVTPNINQLFDGSELTKYLNDPDWAITIK